MAHWAVLLSLFEHLQPLGDVLARPARAQGYLLLKPGPAWVMGWHAITNDVSAQACGASLISIIQLATTAVASCSQT